MEYKDMDIQAKINYVNSLLSTANLTDICTDLKISKKTMRVDFEKVGFFYNKSSRQYLKNNNIKELSDIDYLNNRMNELESMIIDIQLEMKRGEMKPGEMEQCIGKVSDINILDAELTGELKVKSFKVYTNVLDKFIEFSKTCKSIKKQDLTSQALLEYIKNHG